MIAWVLLGLAAGIAVREPWVWTVVVPIAAWKFAQLKKSAGEPWRRIHFPAMRLAARAIGLESAVAEKEQRNFDVRNALVMLAVQFHPERNEEQITAFVKKELGRLTNESEIGNLILEMCRAPETLPLITQIEPAVKAIGIKLATSGADTTNPSERAFLYRWLTSAIIEERVGGEERYKYLRAVFTGRVT
ncbi:MAG: hypothetical protein ACR2L6_00475 [Gemmatimonadaceae bacterium]